MNILKPESLDVSQYYQNTVDGMDLIQSTYEVYQRDGSLGYKTKQNKTISDKFFLFQYKYH